MSLLIPTRAITDASANYPQGYHRGNVGGLPAIEPDLIAAYIKYGITMFGIPGTMVAWIYDLLGETGEPAVLSIPAPSLALVVAEDHSGGANPATPPALSIPTPTVGKATAVTGVNACGGAVAHDDDGVDTDETAEANSAAINDMTLLQPDGAAPDWYALGYAGLYDGVVVNVGTAGADITLDTFEYSKGGGSWGTLTPILNQLNNWETTGKVWFTFERPGDWATDTVGGIADKYWIKIKASDTGVGYSQPLGTQAWILVYP